ncbi:hypothetical protein [Deinococcus sp.]|uniref:hypothetical protein n=1 Tax=Deinococcus sp. TaxID=47478 RepID=UPI003CC61FC3
MTSLMFYDIECAWVPGTTDRVRLVMSGRNWINKTQIRELALSKVVALFGRRLLEDLYLRGRARRRLSSRQLLKLA